MEPTSHRREVTVFCVVTILLTWILWLPALLIKNHGVHLPLSYDFFITAGTFIPSTAGFAFAYLFGGRAEVRSLVKSMINVRIRVKWLLFIFFVLPGVSAVSCLIYVLLGSPLPQLQFAPWFIPIAFVYILIFMGPLGEEAGWRGFALKRMLRSCSPIKAALVLGVIWSVWHLPLFFISGTTQNLLTSLGVFPAIIGYLFYTVMISLLITLLYIKSSGSVFGSILLHTVGNLSLGVVPLIFTPAGALTVLLVLLIVTTVFMIKYRNDMICDCPK